MSCQHLRTEPVEHLVTREVLAEVCPDCFASLPAGYRCDRCTHTEIPLMNGDVIRTVVNPCDQHQ